MPGFLYVVGTRLLIILMLVAGTAPGDGAVASLQLPEMATPGSAGKENTPRGKAVRQQARTTPGGHMRSVSFMDDQEGAIAQQQQQQQQPLQEQLPQQQQEEVQGRGGGAADKAEGKAQGEPCRSF